MDPSHAGDDHHHRLQSNNNSTSAHRRSGNSTRRSSTGSRTGRPVYTQRRRVSRKEREGELMHAIELQRTENKDTEKDIHSLITVPGGDNSNKDDPSETHSKSESPRAPVAITTTSAMKTHQEIMTFVSKQKSKSSFLRELTRHIVFTGIFIAILFMQRNVFDSFLMNQALQTAFVTQTIDSPLQPFPKTLLDIGEWSELRDWMISVIGGTLDNNEFYTGQQYTTLTDREFVENSNRLLGGVRLRQLRVKEDTCYVDGDPVGCYPLYHTPATRDTAPFGPPSDPEKYQYQPAGVCASSAIFGNNLGILEGPGYVVDLPLYSNFTDSIHELIADGWYDAATRAVIITMNFLNVQLGGYVSVVYLILEMPPGGTIYPAYMMKTFRFDLYTTPTDYFRLALEIIFLLLLAFGLYAELKQIYEAVRKSGFRGYLRSMWNVLEIVNLVLFGITVGMFIDSVLKSRKFKFNLPREEYFCDLEYLASGALNFYNINAANIILTVFHTFKYLQLNRRLYVLWKTLRHAGTDLLGFFFIFFVFTIGFLFMGWLTFGPDTALFNTFPNAFATCWTFVMGNAPDYNTLSNSNRLLGPAFFTLFTIFVFFILANMFIAIISDSFSEIHSDGQKKQLKLTDEIEKTLVALVTRVKQLVGPKDRKQKPKQILDLLNHMENPDILSKEGATLDDIKRAIGKDATDADAHKLKNWYDKLRNKSKKQGKAHQSDDESPEFSDDEYDAHSQQEIVDGAGTASLYGEDIDQLRQSLAQLSQQVQTMQQLLQVLVDHTGRPMQPQ